MFAWLYENAATIIISAVILAVALAIIISSVRGRKKGKSSCGCAETLIRTKPVSG